MIDYGKAKYVIFFMPQRFHISKKNQRAKRRIGQEKNKRNEPQSKGQESVLAQMPLLFHF